MIFGVPGNLQKANQHIRSAATIHLGTSTSSIQIYYSKSPALNPFFYPLLYEEIADSILSTSENSLKCKQI